MIVSIGIDLIEVARVRKTLARTPRFRVRVFTAREREYCDARGDLVAAQHYAARFAAKEAAMKALKTGWRGSLAWQDIEIVSTPNGAPEIFLHSRAQELFNQLGATRAHISLSHTQEHAIAIVLLERD
ncbi:MAG: holo-ACP synthase [Pyrinomonadaceae bacterium]